MKTILVDAINTLVFPDWKLDQKLYNLLEEYPNPKLVLSNANQEQIKNFWLDKIPYELFTLSHNPEKTNPDYYQKLLEEYNLSTEDVVYFEHNPDAVSTAQSIGVTTLYFDKDKRELDQVRNFLDKNLSS